MAFLPNDVVLLIVEHITLKSDLKALCQTSRTYRKLVLPRLYHRVHLISWDNEQYRLKQFARCIAAGAGAHLRYTRCLIIEDTKPPAEPQVQSTHRSIDVKVNVELVGDPEEYEEMIDAFIILLLEMFPRNGLRTFGFISKRSISMRPLMTLNETQKNLKQIKISWGLTWAQGEDDVVPDTWPIFTGLCALDIYIVEPRGMKPLVEAFLKPNPNLEKLTIRVARNIDNTPVGSSLSSAMKACGVTFPELQELALCYLLLSEEEWSDLCNELVDLRKLGRLTLDNCDEPNKILPQIGEDVSRNRLKLQHLAVDVRWSLEGTFISTLMSYEPLTSLHVTFEEVPNLHALLQGLSHHGPSLHTLAIHHNTVYGNEPGIFYQSEFDELCKLCSNVRFLGYQVSHNDLDPNTWDSPPVHFLSRLSSLTQLSDLRFIHIRMARYKTPGSRHNRLHIMRDLQEFCSAIFNYMFVQEACPSLKAIVVGHNVYSDNEWADMYCTQHCFIRDYEIEVWETRAVAVPVPAYRIRELLPDCDLLDYDTECESLGSLLGRLQF